MTWGEVAVAFLVSSVAGLACMLVPVISERLLRMAANALDWTEDIEEHYAELHAERMAIEESRGRLGGLRWAIGVFQKRGGTRAEFRESRKEAQLQSLGQELAAEAPGALSASPSRNRGLQLVGHAHARLVPERESRLLEVRLPRPFPASEAEASPFPLVADAELRCVVDTRTGLRLRLVQGGNES